MMSIATRTKKVKTVVRYVLTKADDAHHIIARTHKLARPARKKLAKLGILIDDAVNGVSLPRGFHRQLTKGYYLKVNQEAAKWTTKEEAIKGLANIAEDLLRKAGKLK